MDPFEILGLQPGFEIDADELEARYLELSREYHPDFNQGLGPAQQVLMLTRSAELNDAYRMLRDPWSRAEATISLSDADAMDATKNLCPIFLMEAMEVREELDDAPAQDWHRLRDQVEQRVQQFLADTSSHISAGELHKAATCLHQSNYYRKALRDLITKIQAAHQAP